MATFGNGRALTASGSGRRWCGADDTPGKPAASTPGGDRGLGGRYRKRDESGHLRLPHRRRGHDPGRGLGPFTSVRSRRPRNPTVAREKNRAKTLAALPFARRSLASIKGSDIATLIRRRQAEGLGANAIRLDLALLSHVFTVAGSAWAWSPWEKPRQADPGPMPQPPGRQDKTTGR